MLLTPASALQIQQIQRTVDIPRLLRTLPQLTPETLVKPASIGTTTDQLSSNEVSGVREHQVGSRRQRRYRRADPPQRRFLVWSPPWLFRKAFEFQLWTSKYGWDVNLRRYTTVRESAAVFQYAATGDVDGLRVLLDEGMASVNDRSDYYGDTPLHVAVHNMQANAVRFLLDRGADVAEQSLGSRINLGDSIRSCLGIALLENDSLPAGSGESHYHVQSIEAEIVQLLTRYHDYDEIIDSPDNDSVLWRLCGPFSRTITRFQLLSMATQSFDFAYRSKSIEYRMEFAADVPVVTAAEFWALLGATDFDTNAFLLPSKQKRSLATRTLCLLFDKLHAFDALRSNCVQCCYSGTDFQGWLQVLKRFIHTISSQWSLIDWETFFKRAIMGIRKQLSTHHNDIGKHSPSIAIIHQVANAHIKAFAAMLEAAGVSPDILTVVGCYLQETLRDSGSLNMECSRTFWRDLQTIRIVTTEFGSCEDDCRVWLSDSLDEWSGEFWISIEQNCVEDGTTTTPEVMPGSLDSDDDTESCSMMESRHQDIEPRRTLHWRDIWYFSESRRRRRRLLRYCGLDKTQVDALFNTDDMKDWSTSEPYTWRERNQSRVERSKAFRTGGRIVAVECSEYPYCW